MRLSIPGVAVLLFGGLVQSTFGAVITTGHFDVGGTIYVTDFRTAAVVVPGVGTCPASATGTACIFWAAPTGATVGQIDITSAGLPNGDIPAALAGNLAANIFPLTNPPEIVGGAGFAPLQFMTFNTAGVTTQLNINFIDPGIFPATNCAAAPLSGQTCTLAGSLFSFTNNPPTVPPGPTGSSCGTGCQATAAFVLEGVTSGNPGTQSHWVGNFTAQFPGGTPFQTVFSQLASQGFVSNTFSGTITLTPITTPGVPEPESLLMIGSGLLGLAAFLRRRTVK